MIIKDKAVGCARDQSTTQYCAEAVDAMNEVIRLNKVISELHNCLSRLESTNGDLEKRLEQLNSELMKRRFFFWRFW